MEAVRKIVDSEVLCSFMELPVHMKNCKVEVIVLPLSQLEKPQRTAKSMKGCLKEYANPALIAQEKDAWEINIKEKYGSI